MSIGLRSTLTLAVHSSIKLLQLQLLLYCISEYPATSIRFTENGLCINPIHSVLPPPIITRLALRHNCRTVDAFFTITQDQKLQHIASGLYVGDVTNLLGITVSNGNVGGDDIQLGSNPSVGGDMGNSNVGNNENPLSGSSLVNSNNIGGNENQLSSTFSVNGNNGANNGNLLSGSSVANSNNIGGNENQLSSTSPVNGNNVGNNGNLLRGSSLANGNNVGGNENQLSSTSSVNGNNGGNNENLLSGSSVANSNSIGGNENQLSTTSSVNGNNVGNKENPQADSLSINNNNAGVEGHGVNKLHYDGGYPSNRNHDLTSTSTGKIGVNGGGGYPIFNNDGGKLGNRNYKLTSTGGNGGRLVGDSGGGGLNRIRNHYWKLTRFNDYSGNLRPGRIGGGDGINRKPVSSTGIFNAKQTSTGYVDDSKAKVSSQNGNGLSKFTGGKLLTSGNIGIQQNTDTNTLPTAQYHSSQNNYQYKTKPFLASNNNRRSTVSLSISDQPIDLYLKPCSDLTFKLTTNPNEGKNTSVPNGQGGLPSPQKNYIKFSGRGNEKQFKRQHVTHSKIQRSRRSLTDVKSYLLENETGLCIGYQNKRVMLMSCQSVPSSVEIYG